LEQRTKKVIKMDISPFRSSICTRSFPNRKQGENF